MHGVGGMHDRGLGWPGACMVGGGGRACVTGETATAADGTHPTGMHACLFVQTPPRTLRTPIVQTVRTPLRPGLGIQI